MPGGYYQNRFAALMPSYLRGPRISMLWEAMGAQLDANAEQVLRGRLQGNPYAGGPTLRRDGAARLADGRLWECEPYVLPVHADQRGIQLFPTESTLSKRLRIAAWWQLHKERGTHWGEMDNVRPYFAPDGTQPLPFTAYPTMRIVWQSNEGTPAAYWHSIAPDGTRSLFRKSPSNWPWDGNSVKRSRWWAILHLPPGAFAQPPGTGNGFNWNAGPAWNGGRLWNGIPYANLSDLWTMFYTWKAAHSHFGGLIVTRLQATDDIPGYPGRHPFDPTDTAITDAAGWTSLPVGNWGTRVYTSGPSIGLRTRPPWALFFGIDNG